MKSISSLSMVSTAHSQPICYRNWLVTTAKIDSKLWIRWQNPQDDFPRYSYEVGEQGLTEAIRYVRFLIDLAIKLEKNSPHH